MRGWVQPPELPVSADLVALAGGSRIAAQVLARRGYGDPGTARAFIDPDFYTPSPPEDLPGLELAVARLHTALRRGERLLVWGDFDVDGQTATSLLVAALEELGGVVDYHVPVRAQESHGVSLPVLRRLLDAPASAPSVLLTCDTGVSAYASVAYAQARGVDVIVTDHHVLPARPASEDGPGGLPPAFSLVTPQNLPPGHPLSGLPGVGVAYKLAEALYRRCGRPGGAEQHLDLAALGIVADVARQTADTRYLLQRGLALLRSPQRKGLLAIYERAGLSSERLTEEQIGFILAPRLNALGRLGDANPAVELLTTQDTGRARQLALELEGFNVRRQLLTSQVLRAALALLEQEPALKEGPALVLSHAGWEAGVIGIVASRLVELFNKPAILISTGADGIGRASARSVEGVDVTAAIAAQAELLLGYGGHKMAAGFSIREADIPVFRRRLERAVAAQLASLPGEPSALQIDGFLDWAEPDLAMAEAFERLAPFGAGNPPLVLATRQLHLSGSSAFGRQREHLQLTVEGDQGISRRVVWWGGGEYEAENLLPQGRFQLAYTLRAGAYRGRPDLTLVLEDFRPEEQPVALQPALPALEVLDHRGDPHPLQYLLPLLDPRSSDRVQVWVEGEARQKLRLALKNAALPGAETWLCGRDRLGPCQTLVVWTAPPGRGEFLAALEKASPRRLVVFGLDPGADQPQAFLARLAGLAKHVLSARQGEADLAELAAAAAQKETLVFFGLQWLAAMGHVTLVEDEPASPPEASRPLRIREGGSPDPGQAALLLEQVKTLLDETKAYRGYFHRAPLSFFGHG